MGLLTDSNVSVSVDVDVNKLMLELYEMYITFVDKLNNNNKDFDNLLDDFMKELYESKIDLYNSKNQFEITENIELVGYSLVEYNENISVI